MKVSVRTHTCTHLFTWLAHPGPAEDGQLHLRAFGHDSSGGQQRSANQSVQSVSSKVSHPSSHPPRRKKQLLRKQWFYMLWSAMMCHYISAMSLFVLLHLIFVFGASAHHPKDVFLPPCESHCELSAGCWTATGRSGSLTKEVVFFASRTSHRRWVQKTHFRPQVSWVVVQSSMFLVHIFPGFCMFVVMLDRGAFSFVFSLVFLFSCYKSTGSVLVGGDCAGFWHSICVGWNISDETHTLSVLLTSASDRDYITWGFTADHRSATEDTFYMVFVEFMWRHQPKGKMCWEQEGQALLHEYSDREQNIFHLGPKHETSKKWLRVNLIPELFISSQSVIKQSEVKDDISEGFKAQQLTEVIHVCMLCHQWLLCKFNHSIKSLSHSPVHTWNETKQDGGRLWGRQRLFSKIHTAQSYEVANFQHTHTNMNVVSLLYQHTRPYMAWLCAAWCGLTVGGSSISLSHWGHHSRHQRHTMFSSLSLLMQTQHLQQRSQNSRWYCHCLLLPEVNLFVNKAA